MTLSFLAALAGLFVMTLFGGSLLPLPISAYVLWLGAFNHPYWVILVGVLGSMAGWMLFAKATQRFAPGLTQAHSPVSDQRVGASSQWSVFWMNAIPLPLDPARWMALRQGIAPSRILWPLTAGRLARYALLVFLGEALAPYTPVFWGVLAIIVAPMGWRALQTRRREARV